MFRKQAIMNSAILFILAAGWVGWIDTTRWDDLDRWEMTSQQSRVDDARSVRTSTTTLHQDIEEEETMKYLTPQLGSGPASLKE